ncbi:MAG: hypothetical protein IJI96_02580 [Methanobrevibacter sp.]|nr:hypothetical protein [Methanobrevibacter sp.]MBQ6627392.1 hypothetical protein [Methanobrevibacter sp.]
MKEASKSMNPIITVFYFRSIAQYAVVDLWCQVFGHGVTPNLAVEDALEHGVSASDIDFQGVF